MLDGRHAFPQGTLTGNTSNKCYAKFMDTKSYKIVIAEDNEALAEIYQTLLTANGFVVSVAHDGQAGIDLIKQVHPDLVLLDLMMPVLSGDQVLEQLRADTQYDDVKVVMLTNISETDAPAGLDRFAFSRYIVKANIQSAQLPGICREVIEETLEDNVELKSL